MKKTTNYQLNQWEKSDRIMMEDFNADNRNIEAALLGRLPMTPLYDMTVKEPMDRFTLNIPEQHWENYTFVLLTFTPAPNLNTNWMHFTIGEKEDYATHRDLLTPNAQAKPYLLDTNGTHGLTMLFFPHGNRNYLQALIFDGQTIYYGSSIHGYKSSLTVSGHFQSGERFRVYGIL